MAHAGIGADHGGMDRRRSRCPFGNACFSSQDKKMEIQDPYSGGPGRVDKRYICFVHLKCFINARKKLDRPEKILYPT